MFVYNVLPESEPSTPDITRKQGWTSADTLTVGDNHSTVEPTGSTRSLSAPPAVRADCGSESLPLLSPATLPSRIRLDGVDGIAKMLTWKSELFWTVSVIDAGSGDVRARHANAAAMSIVVPPTWRRYVGSFIVSTCRSRRGKSRREMRPEGGTPPLPPRSACRAATSHGTR